MALTSMKYTATVSACWLYTLYICFNISNALTTTSTTHSPHASPLATCEAPSNINYFTLGLLPQCYSTDHPTLTASIAHTPRLTDTHESSGADSPKVVEVGDLQPIIITPIAVETQLVRPVPGLDPAFSTKADDEDEDSIDPTFPSYEAWSRQNQENLDVVDTNRAQRDKKPSDSAHGHGETGTNIVSDSGQFHTNSSHTDSRATSAADTDGQASDVKTLAEKPRPKSKDAGKTCKERFNFASVDAGGQIMKSNLEAKSSSAILNENRDHYMLNICAAKNKFVIVELSDSIYVETVALANFEFFSSTFRQFRVSVSAKYPVKAEKWKILGTFEAQNSRAVQAFLVESPLIEARYLRLEFLNHYGNEYYCPLSLLRVHGQTMLQEVMSWERAASGEDDDDEGEEELDSVAVEPVLSMANTIPPQHAVSRQSYLDSVNSKLSEAALKSGPSNGIQGQTSEVVDRQIEMKASEFTSPWRKSENSPTMLFSLQGGPTCITSNLPIITTAAFNSGKATTIDSCIDSSNTAQDSVVASTQTSDRLKASPMVTRGQSTRMNASTTKLVNSAAKVNSSSIPATTPSHTILTEVLRHRSSRTASMSSSPTNGKPSKSSSGQHAQPSTQESFFKTVTKRLQQLEANATLHERYLEMQSKVLREAFKKVEKRQADKIDALFAEWRKENEQFQTSLSITLDTLEKLSKQESASLLAQIQLLKGGFMVLIVLLILSVIFPRTGNITLSSRDDIQIQHDPLRSDDSDNAQSLSREVSPSLSEYTRRDEEIYNRPQSFDDSPNSSVFALHAEGNSKKRKKLAAKASLQRAKRSLPSPPPDFNSRDHNTSNTHRKPLPALPC